MTERKILSSIRLNLIIALLAALAATNLFFNYLNPKIDTVDLHSYLDYDMISAMFVGLTSLLLFGAELIAYIRNKPVMKVFTLLKFVGTIGSVVALLYYYGARLPLDFDLDHVLSYNRFLFTKTIIPVLALYSLIYTESFNRHKVSTFLLGAILPAAYLVYMVVSQIFFEVEPLHDYFDFVNEDNRKLTIIVTASAGVGCIVLSFLVYLWKSCIDKDHKEKKVAVKLDDKLGFASIEDNKAEPSTDENKQTEEDITLNLSKASLSDILANNKLDEKEESPELNKEITFSLDDNDELKPVENPPVNELKLTLDQSPATKPEEEPKKKETAKENKKEAVKIKPVPAASAKAPATKAATKEKEPKKVEPDFKAEKQVKNDNPLNVKVPAKKPSHPTPVPASAPSEENEHRVYHVGKQKSGKWQVKLENGERAIKLFDTQKEAIDYAKELIKTQGGSYRIHSRQGKIRKE